MKLPAAVSLGLVMLLANFAAAQTSNLEPGNAPGDLKLTNPAVPTVTFTLDWPELHPQHYAIRVEPTGHSVFTAVDDTSKSGDPYVVKFEMSPANRDRIFTLARALDYFHRSLDYKKHKIAFTGTKTLAYADAERRYEATFNWSEDPQAMELAHIFQAIANTMNSGSKLEYLRRFDRLGLNTELKEMELNAKDNYLAEVQAIAPILRQIADDPSVMELARQRARHLLLLAPATPGEATSSR